jgi:excinuclease UvrABC nuclease subunit
MSGRIRIKRNPPADGWKTPDTYAPWFEPLPKLPGVYVFTCVDLDDRTIPERALYVGKSINLAVRHRSHELWTSLDADLPRRFHVTRWFKTMARDEIHQAEIDLIKLLDPPYNIMHRGIVFA